MEEYKSDFKDKALAFLDECLYKELKRQSDMLNKNKNATPEDIKVFREIAKDFMDLHYRWRIWNE